MKIPFALLAVLVASAPAAAQQRMAALDVAPRPRLAMLDAAADTLPADSLPPRTDAQSRLLGRTAAGTLGFYGGAALGGVIGYSLRSGDGGEDPGLVETLVGGAIGAMAGSGVGAALPGFGSRCGFGARVGRALLGAVPGAVLGGIITSAAGDEAGYVVIPLGAGAGAALAGDC